MAYISTQEVKEIREALKKEFGKTFKFSVRRSNYYGVDISIVKGNVDFAKDYVTSNPETTERWELECEEQYIKSIKTSSANVNHYHMESSFKGESLKVLKKVYAIANSIDGGSYDRNAGDMGADYPNMTYMIDIDIGRFKKPYEMVG